MGAITKKREKYTESGKKKKEERRNGGGKFWDFGEKGRNFGFVQEKNKKTCFSWFFRTFGGDTLFSHVPCRIRS